MKMKHPGVKSTLANDRFAKETIIFTFSASSGTLISPRTTVKRFVCKES